jgi:hypothetical protein
VMRLAFRVLGYACDFSRVSETPDEFLDVFDVAHALTAYGDHRAREAATGLTKTHELIYAALRPEGGPRVAKR